MSEKIVDETAVMTVLEQLGQSWNNGDGKAYGECFTEDADYVAFNGYHLQGGKAIGDFHQHLFDTVLKGTRLGRNAAEKPTETQKMRFLRPDVALVHTEGGVVFPGQGGVTAQQLSVQTFVVVKEDGKWLISAFQNTRSQPMPTPGAKP